MVWKKEGWHRPTKEMCKNAAKACNPVAEVLILVICFLITFPALCVCICGYIYHFGEWSYNEESTYLIIGVLIFWTFVEMRSVYLFIKKIQQYTRMKRGDFFVRTVVLNRVIINTSLYKHHGMSPLWYINISYNEDGKNIGKVYPFNTTRQIKALSEMEGTEITVATVDYHNMVVLDKVYPEMK